MAIITLTSDMGHKDHYVAALKASLLRQLDDVQLVDISHEVEKFNIKMAAYLLRHSIPEFPAGTIHLIGVLPEMSARTPHVIVEEQGQFLISADNGIYSLIFDQEPEKVYELTMSQDTDQLTFPTKDSFVKAAVHLAKGGTAGVIGRQTQLQNKHLNLRPIIAPDSIRGHVVYIDSYENVMTNVSRQMFEDVRRGRPYRIHFRREQISQIERSYNSVPVGEVVALFNSEGYLEISFNQGSVNGAGGAASLFGLSVDETIRIDFL